MKSACLALGLVAASLAGCMSTAQQAAYMEGEAQRMIQIYGPACEKLGYARESDAWRDCLLRLRQQQDVYYYRGPYYYLY